MPVPRPVRVARLALAASLFVTIAAADAAPKRGWASAGKVIDLRANGAPAAGTTRDQLLIQELFARWGIAYDEGRFDVIASLFTSRAQYRVLDGSPAPIAAFDGLPAILAGVRSAIVAQGDQRRHAISNVVIDQLAPTTARAIAYGVVVIPNRPIVVGATVVYSADLVRDHGMWKFSRLVIGMDAYVGPLPVVSRP